MNELDIKIIEWIQSLGNSFFDSIFKIITQLGAEMLVIGVVGLIYWCIDKKEGEKIGMIAFLSLSLTNIIKNIVGRPRPFEQSAKIIAKDTSILDKTLYKEGIIKSTSTSFPSGHSTLASSSFTGIALWIKKRWVYILLEIVILLVMFSRMYLGAHFLTDVLAGYLIGTILSIVLYKLIDKVKNKYLFYLIIVIILTPIVFTSQLYASKPVDLYKMYGAILGAFVASYIENKFINFENTKVIWKKILRLLVGAGLVLLEKEGTKLLFPSFSGNLIFETIRYFLMLLVALALVPLIFKKIKIFN